MIRRIAILEPKGERLYLFSRYQLPCLGGVLLATILRDRGYEALACFLSQREILTRELEREADLIAISSITATAPVAYALVDHYRCLGKRVVMGGPIGRAMVPIQTSRGCPCDCTFCGERAGGARALRPAEALSFFLRRQLHFQPPPG